MCNDNTNREKSQKKVGMSGGWGRQLCNVPMIIQIEKKKINCESMIVATTQAKINFFFVQNKIKKRSTMR